MSLQTPTCGWSTFNTKIVHFPVTFLSPRSILTFPDPVKMSPNLGRLGGSAPKLTVTSRRLRIKMAKIFIFLLHMWRNCTLTQIMTRRSRATQRFTDNSEHAQRTLAKMKYFFLSCLLLLGFNYLEAKLHPEPSFTTDNAIWSDCSE